MHLLRGTVRFALLVAALVALVVAAPAVSTAQNDVPQCSDGIDNDSDNAVDGADAGCGGGSDNDETDSMYSGIQTVTIALPLVSLQGSVTRGGTVRVNRFVIRAQRGSIVSVTCSGKHCPVKSLRRTMLTQSLQLTKLEGKLRPSLTLELRIGRPGQLGKFVSYKVRRDISPVRFDACTDPDSGQFTGCFGE